MSSRRTIKVDMLTRVEGEGALILDVHDGQLAGVQLNIYERPRLFESFLRGRAIEEVPDITARICGICPVAYQMSSVHALEQALGIEVTPEIRQLRRLLYCGEWIESHALHIHFLHAPDFYGLASGLELATREPDIFKRGLRLKKHGNQLIEVLGGRAIHPINVAVGGFYRVPKREDLVRLIPDFEWGLRAAVDVTRWVSSFDFPDHSVPYEFVALVNKSEYPFNEGRLGVGVDETLAIDEFEREFEETQAPHSTALHSRRVATGDCYHVGPLARLALNRHHLSPTAFNLANEVGFVTPCHNPFKSIIARALEVVHAFEEALNTLREYRQPAISQVAWQARDGTGCAATEAPRGLLYHRYEVGVDGLVKQAKIVPPTSQNQSQIERDVLQYLSGQMHEDDAVIGHRAENLIRSYDPCISCATHFLKLTINRT